MSNDFKILLEQKNLYYKANAERFVKNIEHEDNKQIGNKLKNINQIEKAFIETSKRYNCFDYDYFKPKKKVKVKVEKTEEKVQEVEDEYVNILDLIQKQKELLHEKERLERESKENKDKEINIVRIDENKINKNLMKLAKNKKIKTVFDIKRRVSMKELIEEQEIKNILKNNKTNEYNNK